MEGVVVLVVAGLRTLEAVVVVVGRAGGLLRLEAVDGVVLVADAAVGLDRRSARDEVFVVVVVVGLVAGFLTGLDVVLLVAAVREVSIVQYNAEIQSGKQ